MVVAAIDKSSPTIISITYAIVTVIIECIMNIAIGVVINN